MPIRSSILIAFLFASLTILAQSTNIEQADEAVMYKKFNQWVNDTIPTITDQYSLQYDENMQCEELDITIVFNAEVKDGKMTSHSNTSTNFLSKCVYVLNEIEAFHSTFPKNYNVHIEETTRHTPSYVEQLSHNYQTTAFRVTISTDKLFAIYDYNFRFINSAHVYDKTTKQLKYLSDNELKDIYK